MTPGPRTIRPNQLAVEAVQLMEEYKSPSCSLWTPT